MFTPGRIGGVELKNRVVMAAMTTGLADALGFVTEDMIAWFEARARGGAGLVTVEPAACQKAGSPFRELAIDNDRFVPGLGRLAGRLHAAGAHCAIQLGRSRGDGRADPGEAALPLAPDTADIAAYVAAAQRAAKAGFDMIELPACGGGQISQFATPCANRRSDTHGGTLEDRARLLLDILRAVRRGLPDLPVIVRLDVEDVSAAGLGAQESVRVARWAAATGAAAIHISDERFRLPRSAAWPVQPTGVPRRALLDYAARIRAQIGAPVIVGGGLDDPALAAAAVTEDKTDFVALGRALIADPDWVRKAAAGTPGRRCLPGNSCIDSVLQGGAIHCAVNPWAGRETRLPRKSPLAGERICVIGAGPAGLAYAACVAAANRVTIIERAAVAGGALRLAAMAPLFETARAREAPLLAYVTNLEKERREDGVDFRFGVDAGREPGALDGFDRIVVATGAAYPPLSAAMIRMALSSGSARHWPMSALFAQPGLRRWLYPGARRPTGRQIAALAPPGAIVEIVGDARRPGGVRAAIDSAVSAALYPSARTAAACAPAGHVPSFD